MDIGQYPSNSHKSKEEQKKQEEKSVGQIVKTPAKRRRQGDLEKFARSIVAEDARTVRTNIVTNVLIPGFKELLYDIVTKGARIVFYGEDGSKDVRSGNSSKVSYRSYYDARRSERPRENKIDYREPRTAVGYDYDNIIIASKGEAEDVLTRMDEMIDTYGAVSVADFYEMVGITGEYTDNNYGWTDLRSAYVSRTRDGFIIRFPPSIALKK